MQPESIPGKCQELYDSCVQLLTHATRATHEQQVPFRESLAAMRGLYTRSARVLEVSQLLTEVERERERLLSSVSRQQWVELHG